MIGTRLGSFEITAKLGEGGMGEVWRATDSKLRREVAVKVLPAAFTADPERLARFEREAQLLAQLHHPNIASIFGLEESGVHRALVMELVEGEDLASRATRGPIPLPDALAVARQIAEALEAAHEHGIVHRDLKPGNVMVRADGTVKVLDFGLAKALGAGEGPSAPGPTTSPTQMNSPTLTGSAIAGGTQLGVILGTAAYMAPEQAAGGRVDRRADIWSFGVVVYEMLAGRPLFEGETVSHVLASVLKDEPDFTTLPAETPPRVRRLLDRCLRKKPRERLQSIGDARLELEEAIAGKDRDELPAAASPASRWTMAAAGALLLATGLAAGRWLLAPRTQPLAPLHLELAVPEGLSLDWGYGQSSIALSADGRRLALAVAGGAGSSGLLVRDLDRYQPRFLADTAGARGPFFSPDGEWLGYVTSDGLYKVAVAGAGGQPIRLASVTRRSRGGAWGRDGFIYFAADSDAPLSRVEENGGPTEAVTTLDAAREERTHRWPELTADGKALLFSCDTMASPNFFDDARIEAVRLGSGERHLLVEGASQARLLADDLLLYFQGGNAFVLRFDPQRLEPRGKPVSIEQAITGNLDTGAFQLAVSRRGLVVWIPGSSSRGSEPPVWLTLDGKSIPTSIPESLAVAQIALSPDGRRAAIAAGGVLTSSDATGRDVWIADLERQTLARLSINENADNPAWTSDGSRVAYRRVMRATGGGEDSDQIVWRPADGSGEPAVLYEEKGVHLGTSAFSPDGRHLALGFRRQGDSPDIWVLPLDPPGPARPFQASPAVEGPAAFSPDGRWIAFTSRESGDDEVYVRPFPDGPGRWQISTGGGFEPIWSADGSALFFRVAGGQLMRVTVEAGAVFRASAPKPFLGGFRSGPNPRTYGVTPDGRRFLALPFSRVQKVHAVNYADDWLPRARLLLGRAE